MDAGSGFPAQGCQASGLGFATLADSELIDQCSAYRIAHRSSQILFAGTGWWKSIESNDPVEQIVAFERHDFLIETGKILAATQFSLGCHEVAVAAIAISMRAKRQQHIARRLA